MVDIGNLTGRPRGMGVGGAKIMTALTLDDSIKNAMLDIATDLAAANTEGGFGVTLRVTLARLGKVTGRDSDYGQGGGALPAAGENSLRQLMEDLVDDIADIETAGNAFSEVHLASKIPPDFMSGGKHMHRNPAQDDGNVPSPGVGPDGLYDWIVQALNAVATDIALIKSANSLAFTPLTIPA